MGISRHFKELKTIPPKAEETCSLQEGFRQNVQRGGAEVEMVVFVVECYCFLIMIIVELPEPWRPLVLCSYRRF